MKTADFTKVEWQPDLDKEAVIVDRSKDVGNTIHQNTGDIGIDEIARAIYRGETVTVTDEQYAEINETMKKCYKPWAYTMLMRTFKSE